MLQAEPTVVATDSTGDADGSAGLESVAPPWSGPCATPDEIQNTPITLPASEADSKRFYLWDTGAFNLSETVTCVLDHWGVSADQSDLDARLPPNVAEHTVDLALLAQLAVHPSRTFEPSEANYHIIGAHTVISFLASMESVMGSTCGGKWGHLQRMHWLAGNLTENEYFTASGGRDWLLPNSHFYKFSAVLGPPLYKTLRPKAILATVDKEFGFYLRQLAPDEWVGKFNEWGRKVVIPYRTMSLTDQAATAAHRPVQNDEITMMFRGNFARTGAGSERQVIVSATDGLEYISIKNEDFHSVDGDEHGYADMANKTAAAYLSSTLCLVPAGDTATSRRLFDSLAAGCVPIVLVEYEAIARSLPFRSSIDWPSIAVFAGSLACHAQHLNESRAWFKGLLDGIRGSSCSGGPPVGWAQTHATARASDRARTTVRTAAASDGADDQLGECLIGALAAMRARGRRAYTKALSYSTPGIVDALLVELASNHDDLDHVDTSWMAHPINAHLLGEEDGSSEGSGEVEGKEEGETADSIASANVEETLGFIHIPKNAGSTIEDVGHEYGYVWGRYKFSTCEAEELPMLSSEPWRLYCDNEPRLQLPCNRWHVPPAAYAYYEALPFKGEETFCVVRHPYSKVISEILFAAIAHPESTAPCQGCCDVDALNERVRVMYELLNTTLTARWEGKLYLAKSKDAEQSGSTSFDDCHWIPQSHYTHGPDYVRNGLAPKCDHVLRLENLAADWDLMMEGRTNAIPSSALNDRASNVNVCDMPVGALSAESRQMIQELYKADFELFNYAKEIADPDSEPDHASADTGAVADVGDGALNTAGDEDDAGDAASLSTRSRLRQAKLMRTLSALERDSVASARPLADHIDTEGRPNRPLLTLRASDRISSES